MGVSRWLPGEVVEREGGRVFFEEMFKPFAVLFISAKPP